MQVLAAISRVNGILICALIGLLVRGVDLSAQPVGQLNRVLDADAHELDTNAQVLVICPARFRGALEPWVALRESQGYRISIQKPPRWAYALQQQIRKFVQEHPATSCVLLVGDAGGGGRSQDTVPTDYVAAKVNVQFGSEPEIATDQTLVDLDGDQLPDLPIGRLAVDVPGELETVVEKIIAYETRADFGRWRRRIDFTAGPGNFGPALDQVIESTSKQMITDLVPGCYETSMVFGSWNSPYCPDPRRITTTVVDRLNRGGLFWVYIGHGNPWGLAPMKVPGGAFPVLQLDHLAQLQCQSSYPIGLMLACYIGAFDFDQDCLAERMVIAPGGPVAMISGTRVTMPFGMAVLSLEFMKQYFDSAGPTTLGELVHRARSAMLQEDDADGYRRMVRTLGTWMSPAGDSLSIELQEHVYMFHLLGDPLLTLRRPGPIDVKLNKDSAVGGETIEVELTSEVLGDVSVELVYRRDRLRNRPSRRREFHAEESYFRKMQETFLQAADRVCCVVGSEKSSPHCVTRLKIPTDAYGACWVRVFIAGERQFAAGHADLQVTKREKGVRSQIGNLGN